MLILSFISASVGNCLTIKVYSSFRQQHACFSIILILIKTRFCLINAYSNLLLYSSQHWFKLKLILNILTNINEYLMFWMNSIIHEKKLCKFFRGYWKFHIIHISKWLIHLTWINDVRKSSQDNWKIANANNFNSKSVEGFWYIHILKYF